MGEQLASRLLKSRGLQILQKNKRTKIGEIDILALDGTTLIIVEVKTKTNLDQGAAIEMITPTKQRKLLLLARELQNEYQTEDVRVDAVVIDQANSRPIAEHIPGILF
ncbi:MAG TPA: YraN family protein [Candidatus Saccharimonadales bacterium]|nr:YraN family protein [Candidatus Saccharimonadales bacterium]